MGNMGKRIFDDLLSSEEWLIEQKGWARPLQQIREAQFTLGNGLIGSRGILEELPYDANAGTFVAGIFDRVGAKIPELVNLPNPVVFRIDVEGEKVDPAAMDIMSHYRALDMRKGLLVRHTRYKSALKKRIDYQSYRFVGMYQKFIGAMVVSISPLDEDMTFNVLSTVDTSVCNRGFLTEGRKRHYEVTAIAKGKIGNYTEVQTFEHRHIIGYATCVEIEHKGRRKVIPDKSFVVRVKKGERATFVRYFTIVPSFYVKGDIKKVATKELTRGRNLGVKRLFGAHEREWSEKWKMADIVMEGSDIRQKAVRFNLYHLIISGHHDDRISIGARTLSGEGYRGHIFWDAETFIYPFFLYTNPRIARSMLMYRYNRLDPARQIAAAKGYKGALFPWESAASGEETTPAWFKDLAGEVLKIETLEEEHHIVADIAYAIHQYVRATGDDAFMVNCGLEMLLETARFWASRVIYNKKKKRYEMHHIMGPDEFHSGTNNNTFTSIMARFNMQVAQKWYQWVKKHKPAKLKSLVKKIGFKEAEMKKWREISQKIFLPYSKTKKIYEEFEGYFKLKDVRITQLDQNFMPIVPHQAQPVEDGKTQMIKQADVVMFLYMLYDQFSPAEVKRNFKYYEKRTLHKSSLSPSIYALMAARVGAMEKALNYLTIAAHADLMDVHGNAAEGFHGASGGGVWQAMVMGFGGLDVREDRICFKPILPTLWKSLSYKIMSHGARIAVKVLPKEIHITRETAGHRKNVIVEAGGVAKQLKKGKTVKLLHDS